MAAATLGGRAAAAEPHELEVELRSPRSGPMPGPIAGCREPEPADLFERGVALAAASDAALVVVGLNADREREGTDRTGMALPSRQDELVERVAAVNRGTIVIVNAGAPVSMPWADRVAAILYARYPGQEAGDALADVLFGVREPGGRLPTTFPVRVEESPAHLTYPDEAGATAYGEGVFVGYRGFRRRGTAPAFPFGHGLSYTIFALGTPRVDRTELAAGDAVEVAVPVTNTGARRGTTVIQVYVQDLASSLLRPDRELKGFAKVTLAPGEAGEVRFTPPGDAFAGWDPRLHDWVTAPGESRILAGASVEAIHGEVTVQVAGPAAAPASAPTAPAILA